MPEVVIVKDIEEEPKFGAIDRVKMENVQKLLELADTLGVKVVFQDKKTYIFNDDSITFWAKS
jgi:hypothetical protein